MQDQRLVAKRQLKSMFSFYLFDTQMSQCSWSKSTKENNNNPNNNNIRTENKNRGQILFTRTVTWAAMNQQTHKLQKCTYTHKRSFTPFWGTIWWKNAKGVSGVWSSPAGTNMFWQAGISCPWQRSYLCIFPTGQIHSFKVQDCFMCSLRYILVLLKFTELKCHTLSSTYTWKQDNSNKVQPETWTLAHQSVLTALT